MAFLQHLINLKCLEKTQDTASQFGGRENIPMSRLCLSCYQGWCKENNLMSVEGQIKRHNISYHNPILEYLMQQTYLQKNSSVRTVAFLQQHLTLPALKRHKEVSVHISANTRWNFAILGSFSSSRWASKSHVVLGRDPHVVLVSRGSQRSQSSLFTNFHIVSRVDYLAKF